LINLFDISSCTIAVVTLNIFNRWFIVCITNAVTLTAVVYLI